MGVLVTTGRCWGWQKWNSFPALGREFHNEIFFQFISIPLIEIVVLDMPIIDLITRYPGLARTDVDYDADSLITQRGHRLWKDSIS